MTQSLFFLRKQQKKVVWEGKSVSILLIYSLNISRSSGSSSESYGQSWEQLEVDAGEQLKVNHGEQSEVATGQQLEVDAGELLKMDAGMQLDVAAGDQPK